MIKGKMNIQMEGLCRARQEGRGGASTPSGHHSPGPPPVHPPGSSANPALWGFYGDFVTSAWATTTPFPDLPLTRSQTVSSEQKTLLSPAKYNARFPEPVSGTGGQTNTCTSYYLTQTISLVLPLGFFFYCNFYFAKFGKYTHSCFPFLI